MATWTLREGVILSCGLNCEDAPIEPYANEVARRRIEMTGRAVAIDELRVCDPDVVNVFNSRIRPERFLSWAINTFDCVPSELVKLVKDRGKQIADLQAFANLEALTAERDPLRIERDALEDRADRLQSRLQGQPERIELDDDGSHSPAALDTDKAFSARERKTLLGIIGALCEIAGADLRSDGGHYLHARSLLPELLRRKVGVSDQTLANKIKEAREEMAPQGPGWREAKPS